MRPALREHRSVKKSEGYFRCLAIFDTCRLALAKLHTSNEERQDPPFDISIYDYGFTVAHELKCIEQTEHFGMRLTAALDRILLSQLKERKLLMPYEVENLNQKRFVKHWLKWQQENNPAIERLILYSEDFKLRFDRDTLPDMSGLIDRPINKIGRDTVDSIQDCRDRSEIFAYLYASSPNSPAEHKPQRRARAAGL